LVKSVEFLPIKGTITIELLTLPPGLNLSLEKNSRILQLSLHGRSLPVILEIGNKFKIQISGYELFCRGKRILTIPPSKSELVEAELPIYESAIRFETCEVISTLELASTRTPDTASIKKLNYLRLGLNPKVFRR
jgi:hypothetical protein